jgi:HlyD family secretion protein
MPASSKYSELQRLRIERTQFQDSGKSENNKRRWAIIGSIAALVTIGFVTYMRLQDAALEVEVIRPVAESADAPGTILAASGYVVAHHKINVNSKVTGRVAWIGVEKGDMVKSGQILVRLENQEFLAQVEQAKGNLASATAWLRELQGGPRAQEKYQAKHNLDEARAMLANDKAVYERMQTLFHEGITPRQQLDEVEAKYHASQEHVQALQQASTLMEIGTRQEEIDRARGNLVQAQGQLAYAQSQLDATLIRAPVSGTILGRTAEKGELITAQFASGAQDGPRSSVVSLADLTDLEIELDIAQDDFSRLGSRQKAVIALDAFRDRIYKGIVAEISPEANRQKATVQVKVKILNPDEYLRPEMNANVDFVLDSTAPAPPAQEGVRVPRSAVSEKNGKKVVFLAAKGTAIMREVRIISQRSSDYVINGVSGAEEVIVKPPENLRNGDAIKIK